MEPRVWKQHERETHHGEERSEDFGYGMANLCEYSHSGDSGGSDSSQVGLTWPCKFHVSALSAITLTFQVSQGRQRLE